MNENHRSKIVIDTNILRYLIRYKRSLTELLTELLVTRALISEFCFEELRSQVPASIVVELQKVCEIHQTTSEGDGSVIELAARYKVPVLTNDQALQKQLRQANLRVFAISLRGRRIREAL